MKRILILMLGLSICFGTSLKVLSQDNITEVYVKEHIPSKKPVPYPYIREADVMWSKMVWRIIDLREKQNLCLYYPTRPIDNRWNLISLLLYGINNEGLRIFSVDDELNEFKTQLTKEEVDRKLGAGTDSVKVTDPTTGEVVSKVITHEARTEDVKQILVKEKWFFDRQHSTLQVRILGLCPIMIAPKTDEGAGGTEGASDELKISQTFWVYYPEARNILANHEIFNRFNDGQYVSFDDFFYQRRFSSYIYRETNVYNNRRIGDYAPGIEGLYESDRIKESIFTFEHDLWEY